MFVVDQEKAAETELKGILNDWDLSKRKCELTLEQTQHGRSVSGMSPTSF